MNYIKTGKQTQLTPRVRNVADRINGSGIDVVDEISNYINSMELVKDSVGPDFTRTADEILKTNRFNGCNEAGVVFAVLLRAKHIPTIYIQTLSKDAVRNYSKNNPSLNGHVFLESNFNGNKKIINSTTGEITDRLPDNMIVGGRGFDAWDIGLKNGFDDLQKLFEKKHKELYGDFK